jgi:phosphoribosylanthranilate isomerase
LIMHIEIKICGMTSRDDVMTAVECGADLVGFVFHRASPRYADPLAVARIVEDIPKGVRRAGVFVNMPAGEVLKIAERCGLDVIQLHGDEAPEEFADATRTIWRAVRMEHGRWRPDPDAWTCERFVVDATAPGRYGGTGETADWTAARKFAESRRAMLAGGLTPANVESAIAIVHPVGVDVASGVESAPGRKDPALVREFIKAVRRIPADTGSF